MAKMNAFEIDALLHNAAGAGNLESAARALAMGADPKKPGFDGCTPLMNAARRGSFACVELLLPVSDPRAISPFGGDALTLAANTGDADCVRALLEHCDPKLANVGGWTALLAACAGGHMGAVKILSPHSDWSVLAEDSNTGLRGDAFHFLACSQRTKPADLAWALAHAKPEILGGALVGQAGYSTLLHVMRKDAMEPFLSLLAISDKDCVDLSGKSLLAHACERGQNHHVKALLAAGANPNTIDAMGWTPLMKAAAQGFIGCVQPLLASGADPSLRAALVCSRDGGSNGCDALMLACINRKGKALALLAERADQSLRNEQGQDALMMAVDSQLPAASAQLLMALGWSARSLDSGGASALMHAAKNGDMALIQALLPGSDIHARTIEGQSAADIARYFKKREAAGFLEAYGHSMRELSEIDKSAKAPQAIGSREQGSGMRI